jgi:hypothetical protein
MEGKDMKEEIELSTEILQRDEMLRRALEQLRNEFEKYTGQGFLTKIGRVIQRAFLKEKYLNELREIIDDYRYRDKDIGYYLLFELMRKKRYSVWNLREGFSGFVLTKSDKFTQETQEDRILETEVDLTDLENAGVFDFLKTLGFQYFLTYKDLDGVYHGVVLVASKKLTEEIVLETQIFIR